MARPVHGLLRPLLLAVCCLLLLLQVSECSTPPSSSPADHLHHQLLLLDAEARNARPPTFSTEMAGDGRTGAAAPSASATPPARAVGAVVVASSRPRQTSDRALVVRAGMLLRSKPARRFLADAGLDGASCHSYNPHANCPPAGKP